MAARNIQVIISVRDGASGKLRKVEREMGRVNKRVKSSNSGFKDFNRTLFTTTAFIGTLVAGFRSIGAALDQGANLENLDKQFNRVFGDESNFLRAVKSSTDIAISRFDSMQSAIALANLGIVKSTDEAAGLISMAGVAARKSNLTAAEGVKRVTEFMKSGSVAQLEFLNVLATTNPRLQAVTSALSQLGGAAGRVTSTQARLRIGMQALRAATEGNMFGMAGLTDLMVRLRESFTVLGGRIGQLLGKAFGPLIENLATIAEKTADVIHNLTENNKTFIEVVKAAGIATGAIVSLAGALGTLRLATIALGSLGFGLPKLIILTTAAAAAFMGLTNGADGIVGRLKVFGALMKGIFQLFTRFDKESGISKIDSDIKKILEDNGLFHFAQNVARAAIVVTEFAKDVGKVLYDWGSAVMKVFGGVAETVKNLLGIDGGPWSDGLIKGMDGIRGALVRITAAVVAAKLAFMALGSIGLGGLAKSVGAIGAIGAVRSGASAVGGVASSAGSAGMAALATARKFFTSTILNVATAIIGLKSGALTMGNILSMVGAAIKGVAMKAITAIGRFGLITAAIGIAVSAVIGVFQGLYETGYGIIEFFIGLAKATFSIINWIMKTTKVGQFLTSSFEIVGNALYTFFDTVREGWKNIFSWLGYILGSFGKSMGKFADELNKSVKSDELKKKVEIKNVMLPEEEVDNTFFDKLLDTMKDAKDRNTIKPNDPVTEYDIGDEMKKVDAVSQEIAGLQDVKNKQAAENQLTAMLSAGSEGGKSFTQNEMEVLRQMVSAMQKVEENTRAKPTVLPGTRR